MERMLHKHLSYTINVHFCRTSVRGIILADAEDTQGHMEYLMAVSTAQATWHRRRTARNARIPTPVLLIELRETRPPGVSPIPPCRYTKRKKRKTGVVRRGAARRGATAARRGVAILPLRPCYQEPCTRSRGGGVVVASPAPGKTCRVCW